MAKIKFGALASDARGKLDGIVYSRNQYGGYVRNKVSPVQPQSAPQLLARSLLSAFATAWSDTLTDAQRVAWQAFSDMFPVVDVFGNSQKLSGIAMFARINTILANLGQAPVNDPPVNQDVGALLTLVPTLNQGGPFDLAFTPDLNAADRLYIWATPPLSGGRTFFAPDLRFIGSSAASEATPFDCYDLYVARFTLDPPAGAKIGLHVSVVNEDDAAVSPPLSALTLVV